MWSVPSSVAIHARSTVDIAAATAVGVSVNDTVFTIVGVKLGAKLKAYGH
jgi:hypothetical protein